MFNFYSPTQDCVKLNVRIFLSSLLFSSVKLSPRRPGFIYSPVALCAPEYFNLCNKDKRIIMYILSSISRHSFKMPHSCLGTVLRRYSLGCRTQISRASQSPERHRRNLREKQEKCLQFNPVCVFLLP